MAQQFLLEGRSLDELLREAAQVYGSAARIVRAERVLDPGVAGFLGRRHLEVTVEVPDGTVPPSTRTQRGPGVHVLGDRAGILALLETADRVEDDVNGAAAGPTASAHARTTTPTPTAATVSTESPDLSEVLTRLAAAAPDDRPPVAVVPAPLRAPGDLVLVLGVGDAARDVTASMATAAEHAGDRVVRYSAGAAPAAGATDDRGSDRRMASRWDAAEARAHAVEAGATVVTAYDLGSPVAGLPHLEGAAVLGADQVWVVVDARHKADETQEWVGLVVGALEVDALAVVGAGDSRSAHTVNGLGLPLGWLDGLPAPRTVL